MCFPTLTSIWTQANLNSRPLYLWCISGVWPVPSSCTYRQVKVVLRGIETETVSLVFLTVIVKGIPGAESHRASDLSVSQHRLQQEFIVTHPAGSPLPCFMLKAAGMCFFSLSLQWISHTCSHFTRFTLLQFFFFTHVTVSNTCCHFLSV